MRLTRDLDRGFGERNLWYMRSFYVAFPILNAPRSESPSCGIRDALRHRSAGTDVPVELRPDPNVVLNSFNVSNTAAFRMEQQWGVSKSEMNELNILFPDEDKDTYIETMLTRARSMSSA